jgi:rhodanese-like protein
MSSKKVKKYRGPSRPIDPRYAPGAARKKGPDTFLLVLVGVSTAFVLILFLVLAGQGNTGTTTTTTADTSSASNSSNSAPTVQAQPIAGAAQTQTMVAFSAEQASLPHITAQDAKPVVDGGQAKIVDVREKASYQAEHVKGAVNIPYTDAQTRVSEFPKTGNIILYCQ